MSRKLRLTRKARGVPALKYSEKPSSSRRGRDFAAQKLADYKAETLDGYSLEDLKKAAETEEFYLGARTARNCLRNMGTYILDILVYGDTSGDDGINRADEMIKDYRIHKIRAEERLNLIYKMIKVLE